MPKTKTRQTIRPARAAKTNKQAKTKTDQVLSILKRKWVDHTVLESAISGDPMRRLRELRLSGVKIQKRYNAKTQKFEYKI